MIGDWLDHIFSRAVRDGDCLLWQGCASGGYGQVKIQSKTKQVHRVVYELAKGLIPPGFCVIHSCDRGLCVEPSHLSTGTHLDNMNDREVKGRGVPPPRQPRPDERARGKRIHTAKLTRSIAEEIRSVYANGGIRQQHLATHFGVSQNAISKVLRRQTWV